MAIVFAVVGRGSSPSAGVGIAAAGFAAIGLYVLKEHRENFPDFAPWLFEKDYKPDSVVAGIGRLPLVIYIYAVHPEVTKVAPQAKTFLYALGFEVSAGNFVLPLGLYYELTGGRAHGKEEEEEEESFILRLLWEEMWIVFPRFLLLLIIRNNPIQAAKDKVGAERSDDLKDGSGEGKITASPASPVTDEKGYSDGV
ncbi:hypothetical protein FRC04_003186 [Tulasnella sp. 424]|nr:hypothetical protein FRC04_003186 [Tulasnella sp. 424]